MTDNVSEHGATFKQSLGSSQTVKEELTLNKTHQKRYSLGAVINTFFTDSITFSFGPELLYHSSVCENEKRKVHMRVCGRTIMKLSKSTRL